MAASQSHADILVFGENTHARITVDLLQEAGVAAGHVSRQATSCHTLWAHLDASSLSLEPFATIDAERRVIHVAAGFETHDGAHDRIAEIAAKAALFPPQWLTWVAETEATRRFLAARPLMSSLSDDVLPAPVTAGHTARPPTRRPRIALAAPSGLEAPHLHLLEAWKDRSDLDVILWTIPSEQEHGPATWAWYSPADLPLNRFAALADVIVFAHAPDDPRLLAEVAVAGTPAVILAPEATAVPLALTPPSQDRFADWVFALASGREALALTAERLRIQALDAYGPQRFVETLRRITELPSTAVAPSPRRAGTLPTAAPVLFIGTNGIGIGHLTRLLAVARRCANDIAPVFAVFSAGVRLVHDAGFPCEHILSNEYAETDPSAWQAHVAHELGAIIRFHRPHAVVYDGNVLYPGVDQALSDAGLPLVWIHRGLYRKGTSPNLLSRQKLATLLLEPGELAHALQEGPTVEGHPRECWPRRFERVPPVTWAGADDILQRPDARRRLGLPEQGRAVLLQLGAGNLRDTEPLIERLVQSLRRWPDVSVYLAEWPIADRPSLPRPGVVTLRHFPMSPCLTAFDAVISATGYNSFHEIMALGIPALLIANEHTRIDDQMARARYALETGRAEVARAEDRPALEAALHRLMTRTGEAPWTPRWPAENGAGTIAAWVRAMAGRGDWPQ
jgi:UDP:flavonoid glycosyltransferase YjiC (YdhE family)